MNMTEHISRNATRNRLVWRYLSAAVFLGTLGVAFAGPASAKLFGGDEPLAPELVFIPEIANVSTNSIDVEFSITDGYYLYRDKLEFSVEDVITSSTPVNGALENLITGGPKESSLEPVRLDPPVFAEAIVVEDDFFGEQATFRHSTLISVPYSANASIRSLTLAIKYQGCADVGLCYPPTIVKLAVDLPERATGNQPSEQQRSLQSTAAGSGNKARQTGNGLSGLFGATDNADELLPPELAYLPQIISASTEGIAISWFIEDGYYLYRDKISFTLQHPERLVAGQSLISEGTEQFDEFFGNVSVLRHSADAQVMLANVSSVTADTLAGSEGQLTIHYQGCADIGVCFPPSETTLPVSFSASPTADTAAGLVAVADTTGTNSNSIGSVQGSAAVTGSQSIQPEQSEQDRLFSLLGASSLWLTVATFFGLGLLLAFTPCVLPMIPILSSLIVGQGQSMSTGRAFQLSLVYVLVMASTYALVGVVVGLSGYNVQAFLQNPIVLSGIALLFIALSLSMFGFYELQMPTSVQNKLTQWSNKQGGGQLGGVAAMGFISTLIVGPCVTAPLAGALIYIAKTGDAFVGGAALFALGLGMGAPLLLIGTSAGKFVPKAGAWMDTTKHIFGILMLGMAIYMISRFLPTAITMGLYGILAVMSGVYLGATDSISTQSSGWQRVGKGVGVVVSLYGIALLLGALSGSNSYTAPLRTLAGTKNGTSSTVAQSDHALPFQRVKSLANLQSVVAQASAQGRPVMLDFYADWCISCKEMEAFTFSDERVQQLLSTAVVIQADVTANNADDKALLKAFDLFGPPGIIFYDAAGNELAAARVVGFMNADDFSAHIHRFIPPADT